MGGFFGPGWPLFSGVCLSFGHQCLYGDSWCDEGHFGCTDCFSLSQKMLNIVKDLSRQRRGKLPFPTYSTNFVVHVLYPIIIGCWWFRMAHFAWANGHGGIKEKGHYWNNITRMEAYLEEVSNAFASEAQVRGLARSCGLGWMLNLLPSKAVDPDHTEIKHLRAGPADSSPSKIQGAGYDALEVSDPCFPQLSTQHWPLHTQVPSTCSRISWPCLGQPYSQLSPWPVLPGAPSLHCLKPAPRSEVHAPSKGSWACVQEATSDLWFYHRCLVATSFRQPLFHLVPSFASFAIGKSSFA